MVQEGSPCLFAGMGMGKILLCGDGDSGLFSGGEFPVAIFSLDKKWIGLNEDLAGAQCLFESWAAMENQLNVLELDVAGSKLN